MLVISKFPGINLTEIFSEIYQIPGIYWEYYNLLNIVHNIFKCLIKLSNKLSCKFSTFQIFLYPKIIKENWKTSIWLVPKTYLLCTIYKISNSSYTFKFQLTV